MPETYLLPMLPVLPLPSPLERGWEGEGSTRLTFRYFSPLELALIKTLEAVGEGEDPPRLALVWTSSAEPRQILVEQERFFEQYELDFTQEPLMVKVEAPVHLSKGKLIALDSPQFQVEASKCPGHAAFVLHHLKMFEKARLRFAMDNSQGQRSQRNAVAYRARSNVQLLDALSALLRG